MRAAAAGTVAGHMHDRASGSQSSATGGAPVSVHFVNNSVPADPTDTWTNFPAHATNFVLQNLVHPEDGNALDGSAY